MKLAAIQYRPPKGRPARARRDLVRMAAAAVDAGARVVVMPELATTGYVWPSAQAIQPHCEPADGPTRQALAEVARRGAWLVCGFAEQGDDGCLYNSAMVLRPDGSLAACYRKVLLYELDHSWATAGGKRMRVPTEFGDLAPAICMDLNDPRLLTWLAMVQPQLVAFCTNWVEEGEDVHAYWRAQLRGWRGWFVAANRWGVDEGVTFSGRSAIIAPTGEVAAAADPDGDAIVVVDSDDWAPPESATTRPVGRI